MNRNYKLLLGKDACCPCTSVFHMQHRETLCKSLTDKAKFPTECILLRKEVDIHTSSI